LQRLRPTLSLPVCSAELVLFRELPIWRGGFWNLYACDAPWLERMFYPLVFSRGALDAKLLDSGCGWPHLLDVDKKNRPLRPIDMPSGQALTPAIERLVSLDPYRDDGISGHPFGNVRMFQNIFLELENQIQVLIHHFFSPRFMEILLLSIFPLPQSQPVS
jgi:hypothetical protein